MKLHIIFGQRKCGYEGEYGVEALEVIDDNTLVNENPQWLEQQLGGFRKDASFEALTIVEVSVPTNEVLKRLFPPVVEATVV